MLRIRDLNVITVVSTQLKVSPLRYPGVKIVTLIGANGAGKSSTLRAIAGIVQKKAAAPSSSKAGRSGGARLRISSRKGS
jgi:branched-chain amino acid transport system ATP-binding protein